MKRTLLSRVCTMLLLSFTAIVMSAQTITVNVADVGGLWDALEAQGITDFTTVKNLTVTGTMGNPDFQLIKNQMDNLENLDISGSNVTEIPEKAFYQKEKLKTVRLPEGITYIRSEAFYNCQQLTSLTFGTQSTVTGKIVFPSSLRSVENNVFRDCQKLSNIDFSACSKLENLGGEAFRNLYNLKEVIFPSQGNLRIEWTCFYVERYWDEATQQSIDKGLETLTLTKAVTYVSSDCFPRTLKTLYIESSTPPSCEEGTFNPIFENETVALKVYVPKGSKRSYAIANGWAKLYQYMQEMGFQLNVTGYGSMQHGNRTYTNGDVVFVNESSATTLKAVPEVGCELISVKINGTAIDVAADGTFTVPSGTTVGTLDLEFTANPMTVNNPNGGELSNNITAMGSNPRAIRALKITGKMAKKDWTYVKNALTALEHFDLSETDVATIPEYTFDNNKTIKTVHLPSTVTTIEPFAFRSCDQLTTVDGCENIEVLRERAFQYCPKLTNFPFGDKLQSIESGVFEGCTSLPESLVMPASLTSFGWDNMFNGSSVRSFDLSLCTFNDCSFAWNAFGQCTSLILPEKGNYSLREGALMDAQLTELRLPAGATMGGEKVLPATLRHLYVSRTTPFDVNDNTFEYIDFDNCTLYVPTGSSEAYEEANYWYNFYKVKELGYKINISGFGMVQQGNVAYSNGDAYMPSQSGTATLKAVPEVGCQLLSVKVNGNDVTPSADGSFTLPEGVATGTIDVVFSINQTIVENPNGGELKDKINAMGISPNKVRALKVVGKMTTKDWNYVMSSLTEIGEFDISETNVKTIPESALRDKEKLTTVHLPSTVTIIENYAFCNCYQLTTVDGCENVKEIRERVFSNCSKLAVFPFGDKLLSIGSGAFEGCSSLPESLVMPASVTNLGWDNMFNGSSVRSFDLSLCTLNGSFAYNAFGQCTTLLLPEKGDYAISCEALRDAQLEELHLPSAVSSLNCSNVLPNTLERLYVSRTEPCNIEGNDVLRNLNLDNCTLYVPVGSIEAYKGAAYWTGFENIQEYGFKVKTGSRGDVIYESKSYKNGETIATPQGSAITMKIIPYSGYELEMLKVNGTAYDYADDGTFTIPSTVSGGTIEATFTTKQLEIAISVEGNGSYIIGGQTYTAATTLPANGGDIVKLQLQPASGSFVKQVTIDGEDIMLKNGGLEIATAALDANTNIAITFSSDATSVATVTFQQDGFGGVSLEGVPFENGATLTLVKGKSITLNFAPNGDSNFQSLLVNGTDVTTNVSAGSYTLSNISANTTVKTTFFSPNMITVENPDAGGLKDIVTALGSNPRTIRALKVVGKMNSKDWNYVKNNMPALEEFDISETEVKTIPESAFQNHQSLTTVHLSSSVISIGNNAFWDCPQLTTVDGCENVKEIGSGAFGYCRQLSNFPFGNVIRLIESSAFTNCTSLPETLVMPASLSTLGWDNVFNGSSILSFDLSQCTLNGSFAYNAFGKCSSLLLPEKGEYQMYNEALKDAELTELRLPAAVSYMGGDNVLPTMLERLYVSRSEPFGVDNNVFSNIDTDQCILYVPTGATEAYKNAEHWSDFTKVKEYGMQVTVGEQGKLRAGAQTLMGKTTFFPKGSTATFDIVPNAGWHTAAVTLDGADIPFANNQFTLSGDQLGGKLAVTFAANQFNLQLEIAGSGKVKLGSLEYTANQTLVVDSLSTLNFTMEPAEGNIVSAISFNGKESVVQNGGTTYVTPAITANATLTITFGTDGAGGDFATYTVSTGEGGMVEYKNTTLLPETTIQLPKGQEAVFTIKPEQYFVVDAVKLNGQTVTSEVDADGNLTVKDVNSNATLEVTFRVMAEIAVVMEDGGNLTNMLSDKQKQSVTKLTIKGRMYEQDFYTMRDEMPQLATVDLWEAEIEYVPSSAFCTNADWSGSVGNKALTSIRLPESIRWISDFAFAGCSNLKEVNFTELKNLESLSSRAFGWTALNVIDLTQTKMTSVGSEFYGVKSLENIKLPLTLTWLGDAFRESSLTEIDLSGCTNLKTLDGTFAESKNLVKVTLPEGLTNINGSTFSGCDKLTTINFPKSLQNIGGWAFANTKLQKADLSGLTELQSIGEYAFYNCTELTEALIPASLQLLNNRAFHACHKLTSIDLSKTQLTAIAEGTFESCEALESFKLPKTLETIGSYAFAWNNKLGGVLELGSDFKSIGEYAFANTQVSVIKSEATVPPLLNGNSMPDAWVAAFVPEGYAETYKAAAVWEDKVILDKEVHAEVTVSNEGNLAIDINQQAGISPATITHLKVHGPLGPQDFAIMRSNMTLLYDLDLSDAEVSVIPENALLDKKVLMNVKLPASLLRIEHDAFRGCSSLEGTLTLPNGLKFIGWAAFQGCSSLEEVVLNQNMEVIQGYAFEGCSSLAQEITLPRDFQSLGERAFANCSSLYGTVKFNRDFYMFMGNEGYGSSAGACFENCSKIETIDLSEPDFLEEIPYRTFAGCKSLTTVLLPPYLERIDNEAFIDCSSLDNLEFPSTLLVINWAAFQSCTSLRSINLSDCKDFGTIEGYAFNNCSSLETVYLPKSLNWIREYAFADCRKLANLTVEALRPADLGDYVFRHVHTDRCVLSIPTGTFYDYLSAAQWGEFVSMRKSIDVTVGEGANLFFINEDFESPANHVRARRAQSTTQNGSKVKDGSSLYVQENEKAIFQVNPDENVQIEKVLFNGQDVTSQMVNGTYQTPGVTDASSFEVQVKVVGDIHVKELRLLDSEVAVKKGENRQLRFAVYPTNATNKEVNWTSSDEKIATINSNGIITGVAPGRAEITGKTVDGEIMQTCEIVIMSNDYWIVMDNTVDNFVENNITLPLALHNDGEARDIQFDVYLPDGMDMPDWNGNFGIQTTDRTNGHTVAAARMSDGGIRVMVYSIDGNAFQSNDGDLLRLPFTTGTEVGDFDVTIKNIHISGPDNFDFVAPNHTIHFSLKDYPLGDSNGSGDVTITDVANTVDNILGRNYGERFVQRAADANKDGQVTVADVTETVDIILGRSNRAVVSKRGMHKAAPQTTDKLFINDFSVAPGEQMTVELKLDNTVGYTAFQCDLHLPEGIDIAKDEAGRMQLSLTGRKTSSHVISAERMSDGALRILAYSIQNEAFNDSEEGIVSLTLEVDETAPQGLNDVILRDVRLVKYSDRTEYVAPDTHSQVDITEPTGINNLMAVGEFQVAVEGRGLVVLSPKSITAQLTTVNGKTCVIQLKPGENRINVETAGVYVFLGKKFIIK